MNRYAYADNDPSNQMDRSGLSSEKWPPYWFPRHWRYAVEHGVPSYWDIYSRADRYKHHRKIWHEQRHKPTPPPDTLNHEKCHKPTNPKPKPHLPFPEDIPWWTFWIPVMFVPIGPGIGAGGSGSGGGRPKIVEAVIQDYGRVSYSHPLIVTPVGSINYDLSGAIDRNKNTYFSPIGFSLGIPGLNEATGHLFGGGTAADLASHMEHGSVTAGIRTPFGGYQFTASSLTSVSAGPQRGLGFSIGGSYTINVTQLYTQIFGSNK